MLHYHQKETKLRRMPQLSELKTILFYIRPSVAYQNKQTADNLGVYDSIDGDPDTS